MREFGRLDFDQLLQSLARFSERLRVVEQVRAEGLQAEGLQAVAARAWGPALLFGRLWETQGLPEVLRTRAAGRRFEFDVERVAFTLALQRLCAPDSDLQGAAWVQAVECPDFDTLERQHFYRTVGWLAQVRAELEIVLFWRDRDLFSQTLDLVFRGRGRDEAGGARGGSSSWDSLRISADRSTAWRTTDGLSWGRTRSGRCSPSCQR